MALNVAQKLIDSHLVEGEMVPGEEIALRVDQTLTQDATGTLVMLELEALGLDSAQTEVSVQYVDHNLLQEDYKNPDDHRFLQSAAERFGLWFSRPGNGVSHPLHQERFGIPGKTLLGSDSHTCAAGAIGMLAIGAGGLEVALAIAGQPFYLKMPEIWGVRVTGALPEWVSAKDAILEMLRRHGVKGGVGRIVEYYGPGLESLSAMDRHVIANMGAELGATATVFPSDENTRQFLVSQQRDGDWRELTADARAEYDVDEELNLSELEPLIAMPTSPGNVVPVREVEGTPIAQSYIGSSANPGYRDFAVAAEIVSGRQVHPHVSFDVNPASRQILTNLANDSYLIKLIDAGARIHQAGCNGCIGMGQAPATDAYSLRTVPRNFPGRSGTPEDKVCLVSPETAAVSALKGEIADPRGLQQDGTAYPAVRDPANPKIIREMFLAPLPEGERQDRTLRKGPNIASFPDLDPLPDRIDVPIALKVGDNVSTDEILPAGARILPLRSNIPAISEFVYEQVDAGYVQRAKDASAGHAIVGGENYGQGSSREHAALAPRYLGLRAVFAKSFARIHWQNLVNFGVVPLVITESVYDTLAQDQAIAIDSVAEQLRSGNAVRVTSGDMEFKATHGLTTRQIEVVEAGGLIKAAKALL